jgi:hypothetical protein
VKVDAVGDEFAMDRVPLQRQGAVQGQTVATMLRDLTQLAPGGVSAGGVSSATVVGSYAPDAEQSWSAHASALASMTRNAYRVMDGALSLTPAGSVVHTVSDGDGSLGGSLNLANLSVGAVRELASDVTLTGETEPSAYVTEIFEGDGTTLSFDLSRTPFAVRHKTILDDSFTDAPAFDANVWQVSDPGSRFALPGAGVAVSGGNGVDGQTTLTAAAPLEIGGELILEAGGVQLNAGSDGFLCCAYIGLAAEANCFVGFRVRQNAGVTAIVPIVNGVETGTSFSVVNGRAYRLRIRVHAPELYRAAQTYYIAGPSGLQQFGGELIGSPVSLLFEVQDSTAPVNALSTVLYDGTLTASPSLCTFVAINSTGLQGSVGYFRVTQPGTAWVTSQAAAGTLFTRRIGLAADGAECHVEKGGKLRFYKAAAPAAGELVRVTYRSSHGSIARLANASAPAGQFGFWAGKVHQPAARTSEDCENAAAAVLAFSADPAATLGGKYAMLNAQQTLDVWPGDALSISATFPTGAQTLQVIVRAVKVDVDASAPELAAYEIAFANDWAEALSVKLTNGLTNSAQVPVAALSAPGLVAANLPRLAVTGLSAGSVAVSANVTVPAGGGIEVRRRDGNFGARPQQDLVLRSTTPDFTLPRSADNEQFFVRLYDGSAPPRYSRFSSAIFIDAPVS